VSYVVDSSGELHHIPFIQDDICWRRLKGYSVSATGLTNGQIATLTERDAWPCIIGDRVVKSDDGASYLVDRTNTRHWIQDTESYGVYSSRHPVVGPWPASEVNQLPNGSGAPIQFNPAPQRNSLICQSDGICFALDANGWIHHIPTHAINVCFRWVHGWRVTRAGLSWAQTHSFPEGEPWGCSLGGRLVVTNEGATYFMEANNTRRWVQDIESFHCYADRGHAQIRGIGMAEVAPIPEGGWMPRCLSPNRVRSKVVRVNDGTAYFVDASGWWYWIPNGGVWNCLAPKYGVLISNASWEQVNSIRRERGVTASCGM
jgi:hypothetical protein